MEGTIILVVLLYFAFICMDFAVPEIVLSAEGGIFTDQYQQFIISWSRVFWLVDLIFLSIFLVEICLRVYAWGGTYLRDWLNVVDMIIVMASFGMCATLPPPKRVMAPTNCARSCRNGVARCCGSP